MVAVTLRLQILQDREVLRRLPVAMAWERHLERREKIEMVQKPGGTEHEPAAHRAKSENEFLPSHPG